MAELFYVYRHIRLDTNKPFYVGKGRAKRWKDMKNRNRYHKSIQNKTLIQCEIVAWFRDEVDAFIFERTLIQVYKRFDMCESNFSSGGRGGATGTKRPDRALYMIALNKSRAGVPLPQNHRENIGISGKDRIRSAESIEKTAIWHRGQKRSIETRLKQSAAMRGKLLSSEHKSKLQISNTRAALDKCKSVVCVETGVIYVSISDAARSVNTSSANLRITIGKSFRTCRGYHWEYVS